MKKRILIIPLITIGLLASFGFLLNFGVHQTSAQNTNIVTAAEKQVTAKTTNPGLPVTGGKKAKAQHKAKKLANKAKKHVTKAKKHVTKAKAKKHAKKITKKHKAKAAKKRTKCTITVAGHTIPWELDHGAKAAPAHEVGVWYGDGSTTDNQTSHFIGHNPGVFTPVMSLRKGDPVTVTDAQGHTRTYHVTKIMDVYDCCLDVTTRKNEESTIFTAPGERITLQTCITETINRIVYAK
ncbi:sortase [Periweissella cryptocerci]|uniref:Sortase n=1 Tax=Periweissella cryptocerci TaxID=2506420 RepID=A0A4P6YTM9_9LACO|nr:sortase [Periweissella cryptocerci]QBO36051.1 sortase [Periweissella cryptocerci]